MAEIASGSIDLRSLKVAGEPNKYITYITNEGIRIHDANSSTTNFVKINSNGMQIYKGGTADSNKVAQFGSTINLYKPGTTTSLVTIDSNGASFTGTVIANAGSIGGWNISTDSTKSLYYGGSSTTPTPGSGVIVLSKGLTATTSIAGSTGQQTWTITAGNKFGVTTDGTLYANGANITNINGANITGNTITVSAMTSGAQEQILNSNIKVGGRNLVWDTEWKDVTNRWSNWGSPTTREIVTVNGKRWMHIVTTTTAFEGYSQNKSKRNNTNEVVAGDKVVCSFTAYAATAGQEGCIGIHWLNSSGSIVSQNWTRHSLTTSEKRYVSDVFTVPDSAVSFNIMVGDNTTSAQEMWFSQVQLEFGNMATSWSPAPEDVAATATSYITKIDESGIFISPANQSPTLSAPGNSTRINATGMEVFKGSISVAKFGETTRIGEENNNNILIQSDGIVGADSNKTEYFSIKYDKLNPITTETGIVNTSYRMEGPITTTTNSFQKTEKLIDPVSDTTISFGINRIYSFKLPDNLSISSNSGSNCTLDTRFFSLFREAYVKMNDFTFTVGTSGSRIMQAQITLSNSAIINFKLTISYNNTTNIITFIYEESATQAINLTWHDFDQPSILYNGSCCPSTFQFGINNMVSGSFSAGLGQGIKLTGANQFACGKYNNITSNNLIFMVGDGETITSRRNAFTVSNEGNAYVRNEITVGSRIRTDGYIVAGGLIGSSYARNGAIIATDVFYSINGLVTDGAITATGKLTAGAINNNLFVVESKTFSYNTTYGTGNQEKTTAAWTKSGYYPIGVVGFSVDQAGWVVRRCYLTSVSAGTCKVYFNIRNVLSNQYAINFTAYVLWVKITA